MGWNYVTGFIVKRQNGPKGHNNVRLNMQTKDGRRDIAVLSLTLSTAEAQDSIVSPAIFQAQASHQSPDGDETKGRLPVRRWRVEGGPKTSLPTGSKKTWRDLGGSAEAALYFQAVDEAPKISMLQVSSSEASTEAIPEAIPASFVASCSKAEESQAKETCSKQTKT